MITSLVSAFASSVTSGSSYSYSSSSSTGSAMSVGIILFMIAIIFFIVILTSAGMWKTFSKAGRPGVAAIVPVYNQWIICEIGGAPTWLAIGTVVPYVNIAAQLAIAIMAFPEISKRFGKSPNGFAVLLFLCPFIAWPILGFGSAQYHGDDPSTSPNYVPPVNNGYAPPTAPQQYPVAPSFNPVAPNQPTYAAPAPVQYQVPAPSVYAPTPAQPMATPSPYAVPPQPPIAPVAPMVPLPMAETPLAPPINPIQ